MVVGVDEGLDGAELVDGGVVGVASGGWGGGQDGSPVFDGRVVEAGRFDGVSEGIEVDVGKEEGGDVGGCGGAAVVLTRVVGRRSKGGAGEGDGEGQG